MLSLSCFELVFSTTVQSSGVVSMISPINFVPFPPPGNNTVAKRKGDSNLALIWHWKLLGMEVALPNYLACDPSYWISSRSMIASYHGRNGIKKGTNTFEKILPCWFLLVPRWFINETARLYLGTITWIDDHEKALPCWWFASPYQKRWFSWLENAVASYFE